MESWLISERGKKLSTNIAKSTCRRWSVSVSLWKCSTKTLHYAPSESGSRRKKHLLKLDGKNDFDCARKWVACDCTEAELARKETGNWVSTLTMWQSIVGSMFEKLEESSIFSVLYQPASASMKSARDISVMSTNLDARRTQQVSFMLSFSCLSYTLRRSSRIVFRFGDFPSREFATNTYCFGSLNS